MRIQPFYELASVVCAGIKPHAPFSQIYLIMVIKRVHYYPSIIPTCRYIEVEKNMTQSYIWKTQFLPVQVSHLYKLVYWNIIEVTLWVKQTALHSIRSLLLPIKACELFQSVVQRVSIHLIFCQYIYIFIYLFRTTSLQRWHLQTGYLQVRLTFMIQTKMYYIQTF